MILLIYKRFGKIIREKDKEQWIEPRLKDFRLLPKIHRYPCWPGFSCCGALQQLPVSRTEHCRARWSSRQSCHHCRPVLRHTDPSSLLRSYWVWSPGWQWWQCTRLLLCCRCEVPTLRRCEAVSDRKEPLLHFKSNNLVKSKTASKLWWQLFNIPSKVKHPSYL